MPRSLLNAQMPVGFSKVPPNRSGMTSRLPRTKTLTGPIPGCVIREPSEAAPAYVDVSKAEIRTLRHFRRTLPLHGLDRSQRWPTDFTCFADRWLTVGDVTDAALIAGSWMQVTGHADRVQLDLHVLADALISLWETNLDCRRGSSEWMPRPGATWLEDGIRSIVVARNWSSESAVSVSATGKVLEIGRWRMSKCGPSGSGGAEAR